MVSNMDTLIRCLLVFEQKEARCFGAGYLTNSCTPFSKMLQLGIPGVAGLKRDNRAGDEDQGSGEGY